MQKIGIVLLPFLLLFAKPAFSQQLKLGEDPTSIEKSALLELSSDKQGLLLPRIEDTSLINVLSPPDGMIIFYEPLKQLYIRSNGTWEELVLNSNNVNSLNGNYGDLTMDTSYISNFYLKTRSLLSGTAPITYNSLTGTIGITQANSTNDGYLSSTDWNTFNNKQSAFGLQTAKYFYAAPNGSAGIPSFRAIVASDIPTLNQNTTGGAAKLTTGRTISITGDLSYTSPAFNGSANVTAVGTLATVNTNVGSFTSANITVNAKGLITAASNGTFDTTNISNFSTKVRSELSGTAPITYNSATGTIGITQANSSTDGFLSSTDWNTFNNKSAALTFSTGLTNAANTITANLSTGKSGGQSVIGGTATGDDLTLSSTLNATKGNIYFGNSTYDEVNNFLNIGTTISQNRITIGSNDQEAISREIRTGSLEIMGGISESTGAYFQITGDQHSGSPYEGSAEFVIRNMTNSQFAMFSYDGASTWTQRFQLKGSTGDTYLTPNGGKVSIGGITPTADLHLSAGTAGANTAPLKFTAGTNLTTTEAGAVEFDGTHLYFTATNGGTRYQLDQQAAGSGLGDPGINGIVVRTSLNTTTSRTLTGTANRITITNGSGTGGNPTFDVGSNIVDMTVSNTYTGGAKQIFVNSGTTAGINLTPGTDPSSPTSGDFWNSTTTANSLKYRDAGGTTRTLVDLSLAQTLTNKTISGASNTFSNIPNSALTNSSITVATGTTGTNVGVSGSPVSLGGTVTLNIPVASATNTGKLSSSDWTTFNSKQAALTFSTGLTNTANTITANLSTGKAGGQNVIGGTASGDDLTITSTSNSTKGNIYFGTSTYDEVNNRLGVGTSTPGSTLSVNGSQEVSFVNVSGAYTILSTDYVVINTGAAATWTLPDPTTCAGRTYRLINNGTGNITLSYPILYLNSSTTTSLTRTSGNGQNSNHFIIMSDGTQWILIGS